ncbi:lipid asymmetry maintenance protein MlaB [Herbaspirillum sp. YR522]|uniref:STAS domain-containing protein n=1 Tax=Herbaspirillum sp. YR522 TaxID=1144342 RepID=UPI00026F88AE|nr:STAS domain-containing protein [Herbaspirillum sp. YR522]EJM98193.1 anti-anti-sigma regulatory factor (antagonist of anti-sigma factor) [Herbaspirillum sp. YR522]
MPLKYSLQHDRSLLTFNGGLTIFQAAERKPELLHILARSQGTLALDLSGVDEIDTAGVQLLLLLRREAAAQQRAVDVIAYSPPVLAVFDLLQLHSLFFAAPPGPAAQEEA